MKILFYLSLVLLSFPAFAQKNMPVVGHAASLVDLLKKNYNALDPEIRQEEILRDRSLVISIFKSYLTDTQKTGLSNADVVKYPELAKQAEKYLKDINGSRKQLAAFLGATSISVKINDKLQERTVADANDSLEGHLESYYSCRFEMDEIELKNLSSAFKNANAFLEKNVLLFIDKYQHIAKGRPDGLAVSNYNSSLQKGIPFLGGSMGFETYIDGLSRFIAQRIKDELTVYAIENIKKWLDNPSADDPLAEFKVILPGTTAFIKNFSADRLTSFPNEIKQHIEDDLNHILRNAVYLKQTPKTIRLLATYPNLEFAFDALQIIPELSNIKYPIDYFKLLERSETLKKWKNSSNYTQQNLVSAMELASMLAYSMIVIENDEPKFAGSSFLESYVNETSFYQLYTGFLYQQNIKYYDISFKGKTNPNGVVPYHFTTVLCSLVNNTNFTNAEKHKSAIQSMLSDIGAKGEKVYNTALEIRQAKKTGKKIGADTVFNFVNSIIDLSEQVSTSGMSVSKALLADGLSMDTTLLSSVNDVNAYLQIARSANDMVFELQKKQYVTALTKSLQMAGKLAPTGKLSAISETILRFASFQPNKNIGSWHIVFQTLINNQYNTTDDVKSKLKGATIFLASELSDIQFFYKKNYEVALSATESDRQNFQSNINVLETLRNMFLSIEGINDENINKAKSYLKGDFFRTLLVSYYANNAIDLTTKALTEEILSYEINGTKIFEGIDVNEFKKRTTEYAIAVFNNYVRDGSKNENAASKAAREEIIALTTDMLLKIPQRNDFTINPKVTSMINFVNGMATAEDAEGVKKAIEAFALPTGSYSIKRKSIFNLSLNSYPGILPALEITWKNKTAYGAPSIGFTAPVGFSFTWGHSKQGSNTGFFLPIIDIGALTRLRLDDQSTTKALPDFKFGNIFSPGIYLVHGFRNSPLTFYLGGQYGPDMKEVSTNEDKIEISKNYESMRLGIGLVLDIPLVNFQTKSRL